MDKKLKKDMDSGFSPEDHRYMRRAIELAKTAAAAEEVPVGAVLVRQSLDEIPPSPEALILGEAHNLREQRQDPTAHAEVLALKQASEKEESWRLTNTTLYVTLEPCLMCAGALIHARVHRVVIAATDPKAGATRSLYQVLEDSRLNHQCVVEYGLLEEESSSLLKDFL